MNARWSAPAAGLAALALLSAPARAEDVARVGLPGSLGSLAGRGRGAALVASPAGRGAGGRAPGWAVRRATADGRFRGTALKALIGEGTLGPDGAAYFSSGGKRLARVD